eukprot:468061_1
MIINSRTEDLGNVTSTLNMEPQDLTIEQLTIKIKDQFGSEISNQFKDVFSELFEEKQELMDDIETMNWNESALMDTLHDSENNSFQNTKFCARFYRFLHIELNTGIMVVLPNEIDWKCQIVHQEQYKDINQVFDFHDYGLRVDEILSIVKKYKIDLLSMLDEIWNLMLIDVLWTKRIYDEHNLYISRETWFHTKVLRQQFKHIIVTTKNRINCLYVPFKGAIDWNPIEDNINVYIRYTMLMNQIIDNLIRDSDDYFPFQVDLMIHGKAHIKEYKDLSYFYPDDESNDDSDDDDEEFIEELNDKPFRLMKSNQLYCYKKPYQINELRKIFAAYNETNYEQFEYDQALISDKNPKKTRQIISSMIKRQINGEKGCRVCMVIDRTKDDIYAMRRTHVQNDKTENDEKDILYVYKMKDNSQITDEYEYQAHSMLNMSCTQMLPDKGAKYDFGSRGFVLSFQMYSKDKVKCMQFLKGYRFSFLPYHITELWPMFFDENYNNIDAMYHNECIYDNWKLPTFDKGVMAWIKSIDIEFYQMLIKKHRHGFSRNVLICGFIKNYGFYV